MEQLVELGAVALGEPRCMGDVATGHLEQACEIVAFELSRACSNESSSVAWMRSALSTRRGLPPRWW